MHPYPDGFLWGASTASHQVEGGCVNNDWWHRERVLGLERSGDACDSYHRYDEDVALLAGAGLNAYRFSLEWSRIEPEEGLFLRAEVDHYRRMVESCRARGVEPVVTLNHFTVPQWFEERGGWTAPGAGDLFARFCERVLPVLDGVGHVVTLNEPNLHSCLVNMGPHVTAFPPAPDLAVADALLAAHRAVAPMLREATGALVGYSISSISFHETDATDDAARRLAHDVIDRWFLDAAGEDFVGVQGYTRIHLGAGGPLPVPPDPAARMIEQIGWEFYPAALEEMVRKAASLSGGTPVLVTENGIATASDEERVEYTTAALEGLEKSLADGVDVRGYLHWSLLDNFEWASGYGPTFGLIAVDRETFVRTPKPSLAWLGEKARAALA
ncbi:glycoside hydrolase family 1 protein [Nocardioides bruguierae]|uniref:Family 1 glycosylhydrolase n=1 Tax=Nocardioides bruguierae TaxID=2945102 RepID=A0A9X2D8U3_9ACTN|nr:family 1 glycosylhydrolase [Nocardioides bruguierae]MCM0621432.1 family 1 glycosylhydrolase [Nocardioides bruguierae]